MLRSKTGLGVLIGIWLVLTLAVQAQQPPKNVEELVTALLAAKSEPERAALMEANPELATIKLADVLTARGESLAAKSNFAESALALDLARQIAERHNDIKRQVAAINGIGNVQVAQGEITSALTTYQQASKLAESSGDTKLIASMQNNLCSVNQRLGNFDRALEHCRQSLKLAEAAANRVTVGNILNNLGIISRQQGELNQALDYYRRSLAIKESLGEKIGVARLLNNIGVAYRAMGNETAALRHYQQSLAIAEEIGNRAGAAQTMANIAMVQRALGNYKLALDYCQRGLAISEAVGDKANVSFLLEELGKLYTQEGDYQHAMEVYRKSLTLAEASGQKMEIAIRLLAVGGAFRRLGDEAAAIEHFRRGFELAESIGVPYTARAGLHSLAHLYLHQGKFAEALEMGERSIALARQINNQEGLWGSLVVSGASLRQLKQPEKARQYLEEAIRISESSRAELSAGAREQVHVQGNYFDAYINMVMLMVEAGRAEDSLNFAERAKARVLLDALSAGKADISKSMTEDERRQERRLKDELTNANSRLSRAAQASKPNPQQLADLKTNLEKARLDYESYESRLYAAHPELRAQRGEAPIIKTEELAAMVDDKTALLEFTVTGQAAYLFVITKATGKTQPEIRVHTLPIKQDELTKQANDFRQQLASLDLGFRASAKRLHESLLKPASAQLAGKTRLVIVPDAALWELPFQALIAGDNRYLIETAAVSYAPSLTVLREMQSKRNGRGTGLLAFGNPAFNAEAVERATIAKRDEKLTPLPEAETEVKALAQLHGAASRVFIGAEASEARLKSEAANAGILHFATHGILNDSAPLYSHLALAAGDKTEDGQKEDGMLEAWELLRMDLKADLAVLSACETARGKIGAGEGVIGLSWAMFVAGVPSTVVSQWKVESSSTRDLMVAFHRNLKGAGNKPGLPKSEALRQSVLSLLKKPTTNHPFYWAGFVLVGNGQ
ncbi:MAG: CHAT domain-containing tetratricopeptide repeat protein [Acidobacteriota bacterium]|nr:CHAT domain-containing tetratricopeptide repeat protein [Acidobacteriota bacterium]